MSFTIFSFGFRYGAPEADEVFDLRCLKNPYWEPELRELCSQDAPVRDFILHNEQSRTVQAELSAQVLLHPCCSCRRTCMPSAAGATT